MSKKENKKVGRPKELPTSKELFQELEFEIKECEACGAKPATYCHYANGRTLCRKCSRPYFKRHLNKLIGGAVVAGGFILTYLFL